MSRLPSEPFSIWARHWDAVSRCAVFSRQFGGTTRRNAGRATAFAAAGVVGFAVGDAAVPVGVGVAVVVAGAVGVCSVGVVADGVRGGRRRGGGGGRRLARGQQREDEGRES